MASYQKNGAIQPMDSAADEIDSMNGKSNTSSLTKIILGVLAVAVVGFGYVALSPSEVESAESIAQAAEIPVAPTGELRLFDDIGRFVMEDFDSKPTFSGFLPGVAGYYGKPVWSFYVNRGQGISSFGMQSKEYPILEFNAANKAYQVTPFVGFRTFIKGTRGLKSFDIEPFSSRTTRNLGNPEYNKDKPKRIMYVGPNEMEVKEVDAIHGITTSAKYIVLPEENFASMVRLTKFTNTGSSDLTISALDGLAKIEPSGGRLDGAFKNMGRTIEGWMGVEHADDTLTKPFFKMSTEPGDSASVTIEEAGHYCLSYIVEDGTATTALPIVYDADKVFGQNTALEIPFALQKSSVGEILKGDQYGDAKTSSSFSAIDKLTIPAGESLEVVAFYGKAEHIEDLETIVDVVTQPNFVDGKFERARELVTGLTAGVETNTANHLFNGAVKQTFLDNSLRGGMPTVLGYGEEGAVYGEDPKIKIFHTFSRIHGDLERDYNAFQIAPTYFSQGPGNYRDIAQNRRDDVTFLPQVGSFNVQMFLGYIQADGYEPLTVEAVAYLYNDPDVAKEVAKQVTNDPESELTMFNVLVGGAFRPGQMFGLVDQLNIKISVSNEEFTNIVVGNAEDRAMAVYGQGYWSDHWDYYLDLIESYTAIFPDGEEALMYDEKLRYFFSTATIKPRKEKYILTLTFDGSSKHVLQLDSTYWDMEKQKQQEEFRDPETGRTSLDANWQRTKEGIAFKSSPLTKLFLLGSLKFAMRDAYGMGVEYEGGRPGWNDAMNGLPGMVGSGMPETYEMYLLLKYVKEVVDKFERPIVVPAELANMVKTVNEALDELEASGYVDSEELSRDVPEELFAYWDKVATARETYRAETQYYFSGDTTEISAKQVSSMIDRWLEETELGMKRAVFIGSIGKDDDGKSGIPPSYFSFEVTSWELNGGSNNEGLPFVDALSMRVGSFPLFLEGPTRYMKTIQEDHGLMKDMYEKVLDSGLRDEELNMYFLSADLEGQSYDMGRMMAFSPGWLENQSIWTHMSYKYYLQLIRGKLYDQFYSEMRGPNGNNGGILPFMDPVVYGRSLMECSSFMASSAFPDPKEHGRGFLARLSGSTAEFMSMWKLMFLGPELFFLNDDKELEMQLVPALPSWLFIDEDGEETQYDKDGNVIVSFKLFGTIDVTYHNSKGGNLYGVNPDGYLVTMKDGSTVHIKDSTIPTKTAKIIRRNVAVASIDAFF